MDYLKTGWGFRLNAPSAEKKLLIIELAEIRLEVAVTFVIWNVARN